MPESVIIFLKGMAMGIADAVPGVSGGTIAVISGIYERLVNALRQCHPLTLTLIRQSGWQTFWQRIDGTFLLLLGGGILSSLVLMANLILWLLAEYRALVMAFFIGLVLASCVLLNRETPNWTGRMVLLFLVGFVLTAATRLIDPLEGSASLVYIFFSGMTAICAMILPGISGAFILILLGVYEPVLDALRQFDLLVIAVFGSGCLIGLLSFSHLLSWTFFYYRQQTYATLIGMLAASVIVLWPTEAFSGVGSGFYVQFVLMLLAGAGLILWFSAAAGRQRSG